MIGNRVDDLHHHVLELVLTDGIAGVGCQWLHKQALNVGLHVGERVVDLVGHAGGELTHQGQALGPLATPLALQQLARAPRLRSWKVGRSGADLMVRGEF